MPQRIFLAIDLEDGMRRRLCDAVASVNVGGAKMNVVSATNLHVTLMFLGDVDDGRLADLCKLAESAVGRTPVCDFNVCGVKVAPPSGPPRMIWGCVDDLAGGLTRLHSELDTSLLPLGLPRNERRYQPHITLARVKYVRDARALRRCVATLADEDFGPARADAVTIYSSRLTPAGPIYSPLGKFPLV